MINTKAIMWNTNCLQMLLLLLLSAWAMKVSAFVVRTPYFAMHSGIFPQDAATALFAKKKTQKKSTKDAFDMEELKKRLDKERLNIYGFMAQNDTDDIPVSDEVFVIMFHPNTQAQGVHSIEYPQGSGNNIVLAFESELACHEFAARLKAQHFFDPTPQQVDFETFSSICDGLGVFVKFIPEGVHVIPPVHNVKNLGQHNKRQLHSQKEELDYIFEMNDSDMEPDGLLSVDLFEECDVDAAACWE